MNNKEITGSNALILSLIAEGTDTIFGYPGGTIMPIYDQLYSCNEIKHILVRHEQGAIHAAEGYARSTGKTGVCMATAGPGATNFVTGIADAMMDSTPLVCITAQVNADKLGSNFFQEADIIGITLPITKWSYQITKAEEIQDVIQRAFMIANQGRPGPVVISIAKNAQVEKVIYKANNNNYKTNCCIDNNHSSLLDKAIELINSAKKPLILAGHGITLSGSEILLKEFAHNGNIPVATTLLGISSISFDDTLYYGNIGMHGHLAPNKMTQEADVIIAAGMRFSDRTTGETDGYAPKAKIIHIDIDCAEINKNIKNVFSVNMDIKDALDYLNKRVCFKERQEWLNFGDRIKDEESKGIMSEELLPRRDKIKMAQVIDKVCAKALHNLLVVTDVGQNQMFAARYSKLASTRSFITSGGLGTMGYGLPAAIGAKVGNIDKQVVLFTGDGGFQMNLQELGTIKQEKIDVKIVILNNSYLGMVRQWQELFFNERYSYTHLDNPCFQTIAMAYGIKSSKVSKYKDLDKEIDVMLNHKGAFILEVEVENMENVFPMVPAGANLNQIMCNK